MTPTEFEKLVQKLISERLKNERGYEIPIEHLKKYISPSGNNYKIDLSYTFTELEMNFLVLIECKYWNNYVKREQVGYFDSIIKDLNANKGIVVTTKGFQRGAVEFAKSKSIGLLKITNDLDFDIWSYADGGLSLINKLLIKEDIFDKTRNYSIIGNFCPSQSITNFIRTHFGIDIPDFSEKGITARIIEKPDTYLDPNIKKQLQELPENWDREYILLETAGLNYRLDNELEIRKINMIINMLKQ